MRNCSYYGGTLLDITYRTAQDKLRIARDILAKLYLAESTNKDVMDIYDTMLGLRVLPDGSLHTIDGTNLDIIPNIAIKNIKEHELCIPICDLLYILDPQSGKIELYKKRGNFGHLSYICEKPAVFIPEEVVADLGEPQSFKSTASINQYPRILELIALWMLAKKMY